MDQREINANQVGKTCICAFNEEVTVLSAGFVIKHHRRLFNKLFCSAQLFANN